MAHTVIEDGDDVIRVRVWMENRIDTWRKVGVGRDAVWEKQD